MNLLENIYFGNIDSNEISVEKGSELDMQLKRIIQCEESLVKTMDNNQKALFEKLKSEQSKMNSLCECREFCNGVQFGAKLMIEILGEKIE